jgi:hypothetical protein
LLILEEAMSYERQLPFSIQTTLIEMMSWLSEKGHFMPNRAGAMLEKAIEFGCEKVTQHLIEYYNINGACDDVLIQCFLNNYCSKLPPQQVVWKKCLDQLGFALQYGSPSFNSSLFSHKFFLNLYDNKEGFSLKYISSVVAQLGMPCRNPIARIHTLELGLKSAMVDAQFKPPLPCEMNSTRMLGYTALLQYAIATANASLVEHLINTCHVSVTLALLHDTTCIINKAGLKSNHALDDLLHGLLEKYYSLEAESFPFSSKQTFITNLLNANFLKSAHYVLQVESNEITHSKELGLSLLEQFGDTKDPNSTLIVQLLIDHFPFLLKERDLIHNALSAGDDKRLWYLLEHYPENTTLSIFDILENAYQSQELSIIQSVIERKPAIATKVDWAHYFNQLLEQESSTVTRGGDERINLKRLEILHYFLSQTFISFSQHILDHLLREIDQLVTQLQLHFFVITNLQPACRAYASLILTFLDNAVSQGYFDEVKNDLVIRRLKSLIEKGSLVEVLEEWFVKEVYPSLKEKGFISNEAQFIVEILKENKPFSPEWSYSALGKLQALHALISHYHIQDQTVMEKLLAYDLNDHPEHTDWIQFLIEQNIKNHNINYQDIEIDIKFNYGVLGENWLKANYGEQLEPAFVNHLSRVSI